MAIPITSNVTTEYLAQYFGAWKDQISGVRLDTILIYLRQKRVETDTPAEIGFSSNTITKRKQAIVARATMLTMN